MAIQMVLNGVLGVLKGAIGGISKAKKKKLLDYAQKMESWNIDSQKYFKWLTSKYKTYRTYKKVIHSHFRRVQELDPTCEMTQCIKSGGLKYAPIKPPEQNETNSENFKGSYASAQPFAPSNSANNSSSAANPIVVGEVVYWIIGTIIVLIMKRSKNK